MPLSAAHPEGVEAGPRVRADSRFDQLKENHAEFETEKEYFYKEAVDKHNKIERLKLILEATFDRAVELAVPLEPRAGELVLVFIPFSVAFRELVMRGAHPERGWLPKSQYIVV